MDVQIMADIDIAIDINARNVGVGRVVIAAGQDRENEKTPAKHSGEQVNTEHPGPLPKPLP